MVIPQLTARKFIWKMNVNESFFLQMDHLDLQERNVKILARAHDSLYYSQNLRLSQSLNKKSSLKQKILAYNLILKKATLTKYPVRNVISQNVL